MLPLWLVPRVYLDTALLIKLADQKLSTEYTHTVFRLFKESGAALIVSDAHIQDLCMASDPLSNDRVFALISQFPFIAMASSPIGEELELSAPYLHTATPKPKWSDLQLRPIANFRDFISQSTNRLAKGKMAGTLMQVMTQAAAAGKKRDPAVSGKRVRKAGVAHFTDALRNGDGKNLLSSLAEGLREVGIPEEKIEETLAPFRPLMDLVNSLDQVEAVVRKGSYAKGVDGTFVDTTTRNMRAWLGSRSLVDVALEELRKAVEKNGGTIDEFMSNFGTVPSRPLAHPLWAAVPGGADRWHEVAPTHAPGCYLQNALAYSRMKDSTAVPRDSDWTDDIHVTFIPYVDVVTVDKANFVKIEKTLDSIRAKNGLRRSANLLKNGAVNELLDALRELR